MNMSSTKLHWYHHSIMSCTSSLEGAQEGADLYCDKAKDNKPFYKLQQKLNKCPLPSSFLSTKRQFHAAPVKSRGGCGCGVVTHRRRFSLTKNLKPSSEFPLACQPKCNRISRLLSLKNVHGLLLLLTPSLFIR